MPTTVQTSPQNDFQAFAINLRKTAAGLRFAKLLFSPGNGALTPAFIASTMKQLGFPVPDGVVITLQVAQIIASGEAAYNAYEQLETIQNIRSVTDPSAQTAKGVVILGDKLGWWNGNSQTAQMITVGADVAMIIGSMGSDWQAWAALALDIAVISGGATQRANQLAGQGVSDYMKSLLTPQQKRASQLVKQFQEGATGTTGKRLTTFGFIAEVALESPDLWTQLFPQFSSWGLDYQTAVSFNSSVTTWYGDTQTSHAEYYWRTVKGYTKSQLQNKVFQELAWPIIFPFFAADLAYKGQGKGSIYTLALLSMLSGLSMISGDVSKNLDVVNLTPSDFGDTFLHDYIVNKKQVSTIQSSGVYIGQTAQGPALNTDSVTDQNFVYNHKDLLSKIESRGRVDILRMVPDLSMTLSKGYTYDPIPYNVANGAWNEVAPIEGRGGGVVNTLGGLGASWRTIRNYFSALAIVDQLRNDTFYADWWRGPLKEYAKAIDFIATADKFDADYRRLQLTSMLRGINTMALGNVAYFLGSTPQNLVKVNQNGVIAYVKKG